jgi:purine-binding chemotaxis protein CheW
VSEEERCVIVRVGEERYAFPIRQVREVVGAPSLTFVPRCPHHVAGVMNLRGQVLPVVDLRRRLGLRGGEGGERKVVVADWSGEAVGLLVDEVEAVGEVAVAETEEEIRGESWVRGVARSGEHLVVVADIASLLGEGSRGLS